VVIELEACRRHARQAADNSLLYWGTLTLASFQYGQAEWWSALALLDEAPESQRDVEYLTLRGQIEESLGNWQASRSLAKEALPMQQQIGDRAGEAATWHRLATIDLREGDYDAAREKLQKSLPMQQQIGDRAGEAATWHQLATIDVHEGNYDAAREKFQKSLPIKQQIGDRAGEAATFFQLGMLAKEMGNVPGSVKLVGLCLVLDQAIGHGDTRSDLRTFRQQCAHLEYSEQQIQQLLQEIGASYQQDRGEALIKEAFAD